MDVQTIIIIAIAVVVVLLTVGRRKFGEIRSLFNDPAERAAKEFGFVERMRLGRIARSERVIEDPEESRGAEIVARATYSSADKTLGRGEILALPVVLMAVTFMRTLETGFTFWVEVGLLVSMAVAYLWWRSARRKILRTASLNGWAPMPSDQRMPTNVRTTTVAEGKQDPGKVRRL